MHVSLKWIKQYTDFELPPTDELITRIGTQLGAVEEFEDIGAKYNGAVIAKVVECTKHENSDHLNVCRIDDGGKTPNVARDQDGFVQVVCGAPNVRAGLHVVWLPPGATVPESVGKEPFVLGARELRGVMSNGMLASARELALSDDHEGILEVDSKFAAGTPFAQAYELNDTIIAIENKMFTHRPDCFGQLGVAREIAGIFGKPFTSPEWYTQQNTIQTSSSEVIKGFGVTNEIPELCPRYMLIAIDGITIGPSPDWLQSYLSRVGIRPINNIVDITNYIMVLTGQPLHAFDFDKVAQDGNAQIVVRQPRTDETITLLDGKTITPRSEAILITANDQPIALGGVMGGGNSEIDDTTTRILIECANFDMYNIRRTSMEHGIFTDAVTRYTKGQSSWQCAPVLYKTVQLIQEICQTAQPIGDIVNFHEPRRKNQAIPITTDFVNARLGLALPAEAMQQLLVNVEFSVELNEQAQLSVLAPFWRTDIETREDVVEEIGRLYGFDKLRLELPQRTIKPAAKDPMLELKSHLRASLAKAGANELLTYSFVHGNLLEKVGQDNELAFKVGNALSPDLQYYRLSLTPSLLDKVHMNSKAGYGEFALFELGKGHNLLHEVDADSGVPPEHDFLDLVYASNSKQANGAAFYLARRFLDAIAADLGLILSYAPITENPNVPVADPFDLKRAAYVTIRQTGDFLGIVGEYKVSVQKALKLPIQTAGFSIGTDVLLKAISKLTQTTNKSYQALPRFPKVSQDITLKVTNNVSYQTLVDFIEQQLEALKPDQTLATLMPMGIYQREDDIEHKQVSFRVTIASYQKTMTDKEVVALLDTIAKAAFDTLAAERI